jgi:hypothetical protein
VSLANPIGPAQDTRAAIVDALREVEGINAYATAPDNPHAFDAFPRWALTNYTGGRFTFLARHEYDVIVVLPAGYEPDTVAQGDALLDRIALGLRSVGVVQIAEPIRLTFDSGTAMPALRVRVIPHLNN